MGNNNDTTVGDLGRHEAGVEMPEIRLVVPEARLDRPGRYSIEELLRLRYVANRPFDQLNLSEGAPLGKSFVLLVSARDSTRHPNRV